MKPPAFDYVCARSVDEAVQSLSANGPDARILAGGQTLLPMLALRLAKPSVLVDINRVGELKGIRVESSELHLGAMTRQAEVLKDEAVIRHLPVLAAATRLIGHQQTRNRGTIGGSIALADPASEYPALALALEARMQARSPRGERSIPAVDFFQGAYTTSLHQDEMVTEIVFPDWGDGTVMDIAEVAPRPGDFALAGLALALKVDGDGQISRASLAWFGMGAATVRARKSEQALVGQAAAKIDCRSIAELATEEAEPTADMHASVEYRRIVGANLAARMLGNALKLQYGGNKS